jgi:hypothetical protein
MNKQKKTLIMGIGLIACIGVLGIVLWQYFALQSSIVTVTPTASTTISGQVLYPNGTVDEDGHFYIYELPIAGLTSSQIAATPLSSYTLEATLAYDTAGMTPDYNTYVYRAVVNDSLGQCQAIQITPMLGQNNVTLFLTPNSVKLIGESASGSTSVVNTTEENWGFTVFMDDSTPQANSSMGYQSFMNYALSPPAESDCLVIITLNATARAADVGISNDAVAQFASPTVIVFAVPGVWAGQSSFDLSFGSRITSGAVGVVSVHVAFGAASSYSVLA